jgi:uncharacterized protein (TIGR00297 family)
MNLLIGFFLAAVIAILAWRAGSLNRSGAWAAALSGGLIFGLGGFPWAVLLLTFFISSSGLSRAFSRRKADLSEKFSKGGRRDWAQVLANGGLGALLVLIHAWQPQAAWTWIAFVGAMAAVNADTWATELGVLSPTPPRLMTTGQRVPVGTSGGVTALGTTAALGGGIFIGLMALALGQVEAIWGSSPLNGHHLFWLVPIGILGGLAGSTFDSLLGATVQGIYYCPQCQKETEARIHRCGQPTRHLRGWRWLNNDLVNFGSSIVGSLIAGFLGRLVF